jgi:hypothetical protein
MLVAKVDAPYACAGTNVEDTLRLALNRGVEESAA